MNSLAVKLEDPGCGRNTRILIVDDNPSIHDDIRKILCGKSASRQVLGKIEALLFDQEERQREDTVFEIASAFQGQEALRKVEQAVEKGEPYAVAFVDVRMPSGWDGVETVQHIWKNHPDIQVVICTAYSDYSWEQMVERIGKSENLLILKKPFDNLEVLQMAHALTEKWRLGHELQGRLRNLDSMVQQRTSELQTANAQLKKEIAERAALESALRMSEERFSKAFKASPIPLAIQSLRDEKFIDANEGFSALTGYEREELMGRTAAEIQLWAFQGESNAVLEKLRKDLSVRNMPSSLRTRRKGIRQVLLSVELFELTDGPYLLIIATDVTEQLALEEQLRQAQKMEAVGQLAAGVAHDFNNILTVIQGHVSLISAEEPPESEHQSSLKTVLRAAERASKLVAQLLAFSRKQIINIRPLKIDQTLLSLEEMFKRVVAENVTIKVIANTWQAEVNADAAMLDQLLMNLVVNARDAMPDGGELTLSSETVDLEQQTLSDNPELRPGKYVRIRVADTGCGIAKEHLPKIFEPFFTTKPVGKGTGLGLAAVYGIAKQHGGWVTVKSEVGKGTSFDLYLPLHECVKKEFDTKVMTRPAKGGTETVLVVEDDADVLLFVVSVLTAQGYNIISARSGREAKEIWANRTEKIHLLLTDIIMPGGLSGRQLAEKLLAEDPELRVLYTSGYSEDFAGKKLVDQGKSDFLSKPYEVPVLIRRVRASLDASNTAGMGQQ